MSIREYLIKQGHVLTRDWLPDAEKRLLHGNFDMEDIKEIYKSCMTAIKDAEVVIIEDTISNFSTGHQITLALQYKKPTLVLWQAEKSHSFKKMFIHGIQSDILQVSEYTRNTLQKTLEVFLRRFENAQENNRFHLVISDSERVYLDWAKYVKNTSRTKVIREALKNTIREDKEYQLYLNGEDCI